MHLTGNNEHYFDFLKLTASVSQQTALKITVFLQNTVIFATFPTVIPAEKNFAGYESCECQIYDLTGELNS